MRLKEYPDAEMMMLEVADRIASDLNTCLMSHDRASLSVSGGTSPGPVFDSLSAADLDWSRVHVFPNDERCVPPGHERSNARLIRERLLTGRAAAARFLPMYEEGQTPEEAAAAASARLEGELPVSVLLLGMGDDMHTASLFPDSPQLRAALAPDAPVAMAVESPSQPEARITLAAHVLRGAMTTHVLVKGRAKRDAIERARRLPPQEAPITSVWDDATVHWAEG
ncbi:6-phosphogluconolactonase [Hasllibacter halocynthiae]|uniref:6-phosphogluconolactonase n=1 Tax=Hasllibacter halocynthiae TaxID=595589 RepID=A0A2T0X8E8_9RHOB|nr:6-phosphogluconolactonase [Hasllibacter halocynthiae]PRY95221.1 6-phosphogluconolactonase [Hasllibacter halocynthiae]